MESSANYGVSCTKCSKSKSSNSFETVRDFAFKHQKHTGHPVDWTDTNIDSELSKKLDLEYQIVCNECEDDWTFEELDEAKTFYDEHDNVTDHTPGDIRHLECGIEIDRPEDLVKLIDRLNTRTDGADGAPRQIIIKAARHRGGDFSRTEKWLDKLSQQGALYEPTQNYYRTV